MSLLLLLRPGSEEGPPEPPGPTPVGLADADELLVASKGDVYVAPVGTPLPTLVRTPLHSAFYQIGLVSEDGVSLAVAPEVDEQEAWQAANPVRMDLVEQRIAVTFDMLQWNSETVLWAFGGGSITQFSPGQWRYDFPDPDTSTLDERSLVIDWEDGPKAFRLVFARGTVLGGLSTTLQRSALATLPIGFDVLAVDGTGSPGYLFLSAQPRSTVPPPPPPPPGEGEMGSGTMGEGTMG